MTATDPRLAGFTPITALMGHIAASGRAYPRVRLDLDGNPLVLTVAGSRAKTPGAVNLTDGRRYPDNAFYGRIMPDGAFVPGRDARTLDPVLKAAFWATLSRMKAGEAEAVFAENGHKTGCCCLCGRPLSNQESVELGMGPVCRERAFG